MKRLSIIITLLLFFISVFSFNSNACPFPAPVFSGTTTVCGKSVHAYSVTNTTYFTSYNWKVKGGNVISGQGTKSVSVRWHDSGAASITVVTEDNSVCTDSSQQLITIQPLPAVNNSNIIPSVCYGDTIRLSEPECKNCTYSWHDTRYIHLGLPSLSSTYFYNFVPKPGSSNKDFQVMFKVSITDPVTKCTVNDTIRVKLKATVDAKLSGANDVCTNATEAYAFTNTNKPDSFKWIVENGTIVSGENTQGIIVRWSKTSKGKVQLVAYSNCIETSSIDVNIYEQPNPAIQVDYRACMGNTVMYKVNKNTARSYKWSVTGGSIIGSDARDSVYVRWSSSGTTFRISITATNATNCVGSTFEDIVLHPKPIAWFTSTTSETCAGTAIDFTNTSSYADSFYWSFGDGSFSQQQNPSHTFTNAGTYNVKLIARGTGNCPDSTIKVITINPKPSSRTIVGDINVIIKDTSLYYVNATPGNSYLWKVNGGKLLQYGGTTDSLVVVVWDTVGTGSVELTETTSKACIGEINKLVVNIERNVSIKENERAKEALKIFPNPVSDKINIVYEAENGGNINVVLADALGKTIYKEEKQIVSTGKNVFYINAAQINLPDGIYYLTIITSSGTVSQKIIKL